MKGQVRTNLISTGTMLRHLKATVNQRTYDSCLSLVETTVNREAEREKVWCSCIILFLIEYSASSSRALLSNEDTHDLRRQHDDPAESYPQKKQLGTADTTSPPTCKKETKPSEWVRSRFSGLCDALVSGTFVWCASKMEKQYMSIELFEIEKSFENFSFFF